MCKSNAWWYADMHLLLPGTCATLGVSKDTLPWKIPFRKSCVELDVTKRHENKRGTICRVQGQ